MIGRNVYETILEQVETGMCAKGLRVQKGRWVQSGEVSGSFKVDLEDGLSLTRWGGR